MFIYMWCIVEASGPRELGSTPLDPDRRMTECGLRAPLGCPRISGAVELAQDCLFVPTETCQLGSADVSSNATCHMFAG